MEVLRPLDLREASAAQLQAAHAAALLLHAQLGAPQHSAALPSLHGHGQARRPLWAPETRGVMDGHHAASRTVLHEGPRDALAHAHALVLEDERVAQQSLLLALSNRAEALAEPRPLLLSSCAAVLGDGLAAAVGVGSLRLRFSLLAMLRTTQLLPLAAIPLAPLLLLDRLLDASALFL